MIDIVLGIIMAFAHYSSDKILKRFKNYKGEIVSFSAGIAITYIFLDLFPEFAQGVGQKREFLFLFLLFGFVIFHIIEKYIYKQHLSEYKRLKELALEHSAISFIYHFIVGMLIVNFLTQSFKEGLLFFIPVLFYTMVDTIPVNRTKSSIIKIILAISTLLGIFFVKFIQPILGAETYLILIGFVIGALLFTVIRHSIPEGKKGKPLYFVLGVVIYSLILLIL